MARARLQDVAVLAGVSTKTVSNVINNHPYVRPATLARVQAAIAELNYRPHAIGRQLRRGRTGMLALAVPEINVPYFAELARHVVDAAAQQGLTMLIEQTNGELAAERAVADTREAGLVDGILFYPVSMPATEIHARRDSSPMVLLGDRRAPASVDHVTTDNVAAAAEAVRHLLSLGRRRIAFLGVQPGARTGTSQVRLKGFSKALEAAGIRPARELLLPVPEYSYAAGESATVALLRSSAVFDAVVCASDLLAVGALRALRQHGRQVPAEVAVVGWDDIAEAAYTHPGLTSVAADKHRIAQAAVHLVMGRIEGSNVRGRRVRVPHRLVIRESTAVSHSAASTLTASPHETRFPIVTTPADSPHRR